MNAFSLLQKHPELLVTKVDKLVKLFQNLFGTTYGSYDYPLGELDLPARMPNTAQNKGGVSRINQKPDIKIFNVFESV